MARSSICRTDLPGSLMNAICATAFCCRAHSPSPATSSHARLHGTTRRRRPRQADRLHQIPRQIGNRAMATITADIGTDYLTAENSVRSWLLTKDHKRIGLLFFVSITFFFFIGGIAATFIRLHLATPAGLLQPSIYNRMFTMHGI